MKYVCYISIMNKDENQKELMQLIIESPKGKILTDKIYALSSKNELGEFDILYGHRNFISQIFDEIKIWKDKKNFKRYKIGTGVIKIENNEARIFLKVDDFNF